MLRSVIAVGLSMALQGGSLSASLVHAHLDGHHHNGLPVVHAHVGGHHHGGHPRSNDRQSLSSRDESDRVAYLQVFLAVHPDTGIGPAVASAGYPAPSVRELVLGRMPDMVRSHGPPAGRPEGSRAPPALLS